MNCGLVVENISTLYLWDVGASMVPKGAAGPIRRCKGIWFTYVTLALKCWARNLAVGGSEKRYTASNGDLRASVGFCNWLSKLTWVSGA